MIYLFYFFSGFTALALEIAWIKKSSQLFGSTGLAAAAIVAAFMTGLSLGSYFLGRWADKAPEKGLRRYAILEGIIGVFALVYPLLLIVMEPLYRGLFLLFMENFTALSAIRFGLSFLLLLIPTALMGGSFPLLARYMTARKDCAPGAIAKLYASNLAGAMTGCVFAGYLLLPTLGIAGTIYLVAGICFVLMFFIWSYERVSGIGGAPASVLKVDVQHSLGYPMLALVLVQGVLAFVVQACWTRFTGLLLGSSVYAFSAMLTVFLGGLGLGGWLMTILRAKNWIRSNTASVAWVQIVSCMAVLLFLPVFERLFFYYAKYFPLISSAFWVTATFHFIFASVAMLIPATILGMTLPLALDGVGYGRTTGKIYAVNTAGAVLGSCVSVFYLIPKWGLHGGLYWVCVMSVVASVTVYCLVSRKVGVFRKITYSLAAIISVAGLTLLPWSPQILSSGMFIYGNTWSSLAQKSSKEFFLAARQLHPLLYYRDGVSSTVSVHQYVGNNKADGVIARSLRVNGKTDASNTGDMATQLSLGYIPVLAHASPKNVLVIGLGSGATLGAVAQISGIESIDCAEIEKRALEANRYFSDINHEVLSDPRVRVLINDGRNFLKYSPKRYDVIISEPSNPWIAGVSSLFTRECYQDALTTLSEGGVYGQWLHSYQLSEDDFKMIVRTFVSVFPEAQLFHISSSDFLLLGSREKIIFSHEKMTSALQRSASMRQDFDRYIKYGRGLVLGTYVAGSSELRSWVAGKDAGPLNQDDHLHLEYQAPMRLYRSESSKILQSLSAIRQARLLPAHSDRDWDDWRSDKGLGGVYLEMAREAVAEGRQDLVMQWLDMGVRATGPTHETVYKMAQIFERSEAYPLAIRHYRYLQKISAYQNIASSGMRRARIKQKMKEDPASAKNAVSFEVLASLSFEMGDYAEAILQQRMALTLGGSQARRYADLAVYELASGDILQATVALNTAKALDPRDSQLIKASEFIVKTLSS